MKQQSIEEIVQNCLDNANEAEEDQQALVDSWRRGLAAAPEVTPEEAAETAFLASMPHLASRSGVQAYIACIAAGVQHKILSPQVAKSLLYTAQIALSAHAKRKTAAKIRHVLNVTPPPTGGGMPQRKLLGGGA